MHGFDWAGWALSVAPGFFLLSLVLPLGPRVLRLRWARDGFLLIVFMVVLGLLGHSQVEALAGLALIGGSFWLGVRSWRLSRRIKRRWLARWQQEPAIELAVPFRGRWKALACGPDAAKNHHLAAPDQWFALDFVRVDGESFGSEIVSPVAGVVAHVEEGHADVPPGPFFRKPNTRSPAGNYVSIQVLSGFSGGVSGAAGATVYLLLCHLRQGSVRVGVGARVEMGDVVGLCGNSGNTSRPHLHMHAQDRAEIAVGRAVGVPVRLPGGDAEWMRPGTILEG
jgi:hypothetical protein